MSHVLFSQKRARKIRSISSICAHMCLTITKITINDLSKLNCERLLCYFCYCCAQLEDMVRIFDRCRAFMREFMKPCCAWCRGEYPVFDDTLFSFLNQRVYWVHRSDGSVREGADQWLSAEPNGSRGLFICPRDDLAMLYTIFFSFSYWKRWTLIRHFE